MIILVVMLLMIMIMIMLIIIIIIIIIADLEEALGQGGRRHPGVQGVGEAEASGLSSLAL